MGAIAAIGTAVTAVASSVGIGITASALTVGFGTIAAVGAVTSAVGMVTHNKALSIAGAVLGGIGGVGALASSAGVFGAASAASVAPATPAAADIASAGTVSFIDSGNFAAEGAGAVEGANVVSAADAAASAAALPTAVDTGSFAAQGAAGVGLGNALGAAKPALGLFNATQGTPTTEELAAQQKLALAPTATTTGSAPPPPAAALPSNVPGSNAPLTPAGQNVAGQGVPGGDQPLSGRSLVGDAALRNQQDNKSAFDKVLDFTESHPLTSLGVLQAAGSLVSGWTSQSLTPAQIKAYEAQANANDAATALQKQQTANLAMPKAVASSTPVSGQAQLVPVNLRPPPIPAPQGGFINAPPITAPAVTGVAA